MDNIKSLSYFLPELFLSGAIMVIIIIDLIFRRAKRNYTAHLALAALMISILLAFRQYDLKGSELFSGMIVLDSLAILIKIITALATMIIILFSLPEGKIKSEYYILLLITVIGMFLMAGVNDLLMIILSMELVGLVSYVLSGFNKDNSKSNEAALKYVLYAAVSTGVMAFGFSYLYGMTAETNLIKIQSAFLSNPPMTISVFIAFLLILGGLGYKIAMAPFHFWLPDVYEGAPTPITAFFSVAPKAAGIAVLIRFLTTVIAHPGAAYDTEYVQNLEIHAPVLIAILSVITMSLGNLSALRQKNIKRMMAYSSIAHAGYILMAFVVFNKQGYEAILFYLVVYLFMNLGAFSVIHMITPNLGSENIEAYKGLGYRQPFAAVSLAIFLFSLTGLPPLAGFIGKFYLFASVINAQWYWLAVVGVLNSVISLYYYAYVVKMMFLQPADDETAIQLSLYNKMVLALLVIPTLVFGLYWSPILNFTSHSLGMLIGVK
jgi:NADH-quinone oxidoreductase subunit N